MRAVAGAACHRTVGFGLDLDRTWGFGDLAVQAVLTELPALDYESERSFSFTAPQYGEGGLLMRRANVQLRYDRRDEILAAAQRCFVRSGFHGASMQDICAEAGMSPGNLYRYFPSKEALVAGIAERDRAEVAQQFASADLSHGLLRRPRRHGASPFRREADRAGAAVHRGDGRGAPQS